MILPSYEEWQENAKTAFLESHEEQSCWHCEGEGETECWECGHEKECTECDGAGVLYKNSRSGEEVKMFCGSPQEYYRSMMKELSRLAKWKGNSSVIEMLPFARSYRKQYPTAVRLRKYRKGVAA